MLYSTRWFPANPKIALPEDLIKPAIKWHHQVTGHPGSKWLYGQLWQRCYHRDLQPQLWHLPDKKLDGKGYGFFPINPIWRMGHGSNRSMDSSSSWKTIGIWDTNSDKHWEKKDSDHVMQMFVQCWLTCYPWPQCCTHYPGGEFTGQEFQTLL